jgi:hypothetical protein
MIATPGSWTLSDASSYRREPARPIHKRQTSFDAEFDSLTVFYDCFRLASNQVMLIGPPLNQFAGILDSLTIVSHPSQTKCSYQVEHMLTTGFANRQTHNICRLLVEVPAGDRVLHMEAMAGATQMEVRSNAAAMFHGKQVLFTLSRNNHPQWICDWMRFHRDLHQANAVLLYDNASDAYTTPALLKAMKQVAGYDAVVVVQWPFKYGPQGVGRGTWDSSFSQDGAMEDARWRFLSEARAVLNCDIDELILSRAASIYDLVEASPAGYVQFAGRWVNTPAEHVHDLPRHKESSYQARPQWRWRGLRPKDLKLCPTKWAVVPARCPANVHWSVHEIVGMPPNKVQAKNLSYRHFAQISTNWKKNRKSIDPAEMRQHKQDAELLAAFAKVNWET